MFGLLAVFLVITTAVVTGMFIALLRENGYAFVQTFRDIVEAIQEIKSYKASQTTRGS